MIVVDTLQEWILYLVIMGLSILTMAITFGILIELFCWLNKKLIKEKEDIPYLYPKLLSEDEYMKAAYEGSIGIKEEDMFLYPGEYEDYLKRYKEYKTKNKKNI